MSQSTHQSQPLKNLKNLTLKNLTLEELIVLAQQEGAPNMAALGELVQRTQKSVFAMLYQLAPERSDTADMAQEVLLRMCRSIKSLRDPKLFKFWLNRIVTNLFYDELRKASRRPNVLSMDAPLFDDEDDRSPTHDIPDQSDMPETRLLGSELDQKIHAAMAQLPEQFRLMIVLREMQGLSYEEIASLTQCNIGTVKSRLARARLKLQEILKPYLKDTPEDIS